MTEPDYSTWLTKQQAADAIQVTTKTIERLAQDGKVQQAHWRRDGRGPELRVYEPSDVARLAQERQRGPLPPFLVPPGVAPPTNGNGHHPEALVRVPTAGDLPTSHIPRGDDLVALLVAGAKALVSQTSQTDDGLLTVQEAAVRKRVSPRYLRAAIKAGALDALPHGRSFLIHPDELKAFGRRKDKEAR